MNTVFKILPESNRTGAPALYPVRNVYGIRDSLGLYATGTGLGTTILYLYCIESIVLKISGGNCQFKIGNTYLSSMRCEIGANNITLVGYTASTLEISDVTKITHIQHVTVTNGPGISGSLNNWKALTFINIYSSNAISLNLDNLSPGVIYLRMSSTSVSGSITRFIDTLQYLQVNSAITGSINGFNLIYFVSHISNQITGSISNMNTLLQLTLVYNGGNNITGDISTLTNITTLTLTANTSVTGIYTSSICTYLYYSSSNSVAIVDVSLMTGLSYLYAYGNTNLTGNLGAICGAAYFNTNSNSGGFYYIAGSGNWKNLNFSYFTPVGVGLTSTEVDNILIDMAASVTTPTNKIIELRGANGARTVASDAAYTHLTVTHGCTVNTN